MQPPIGPPSVFSTVYNTAFHKGHKRRPDKDRLIQESHKHHGTRLKVLRGMVQTFPATWDSFLKGWMPPIRDQGQCGSCHDDKTEVLTEKGWTKWADYDWQTALGTMNTITGLLEFQLPLKQHVYDYDGPMHYYDGRSTDFTLTPNHQMYWWGNNPYRAPTFTPISQMPRYAIVPHATSGWVGLDLLTIKVGSRKYLGDDFIALVALVISDGHVGHIRDDSSSQNKITFCCFKENKQQKVRALAHRLGIQEQQSRPGVWYFSDPVLSEWFRQSAYDGQGFTAPFKRIPEFVRSTSQRQIRLFLDFFGDQHTQDCGSTSYYSCSQSLIDDLQELLLRVGKRGTIMEFPARVGGRNAEGRQIVGNYPEFSLVQRKRDSLCIEKHNTHIDHYKGKVYCATVPNHTLVTRRNKRVLISSNCWDFSGTRVCTVAYIRSGIFPNDGSKIFSEQYTLDCGRNGGCGGDDNITVLEWALQHGLPLDSDYGPYEARSGRCSIGSHTLYKINKQGLADTNGGGGIASVESIKTAIMAYGCVGSGVAADGAFSNYKAGTVFDRNTSSSIDHDIVLSGWGDTATKTTSSGTVKSSHSSQTATDGFWWLDNSWNTSWGDKGRMRIGWGINQVGSEACWAEADNPNPPPPWQI